MVRLPSRRRSSLEILAGALALAAPATAHAGGLDTAPENGAMVLGRGGTFVAKPDDPLAVYMNPAGMSFQSNGVTVGAHLLVTSECFARKGPGNTPVSPGNGIPAPGSPNGPPEETCTTSVFPNPQIAAVFKPLDRLAIGLAVVAPHAGNVPWPETIDYERNGITFQEPAPSRYLVTDKNALLVFPTLSVSYAITPEFSFGAGFVWGFASIDFTTYVETLSGSAQDDFAAHQDVKAHFQARDFFVPGLVAGLDWRASDRVELGAWYHFSDSVRTDATDLTLTSQNFNNNGSKNEDPCKGNPDPNCNITDAPAAGSLRVSVPMEAKVGVRYHHPLGVKSDKPKWADKHKVVHDSLSQDRFDIEADLTWSNNSSFDTIEIRFGPEACRQDPNCVDSGIPVKGTPGQVPVNGDIPHNWRDVVGVRLGSDVTVLPNRLAVRLGGFFESKGQRDEYLNLDFDQSWKLGLTLGGTVRVGPADLHLAYSHVFFGTLDNGGNGKVHALSGDATSAYRSLQAVNGGRFSSSLDDVGLAATFRF